ncbi:MAG TPA: ribonuclease J [Geminicoccaceae bacterium]
MGMDADGHELVFVPLGGAGEIGLNLNLYGLAGRWLMVDLGISFADETLPGVEIVLPDPAFIAERRDALAGLVLTHAHEDHFGAIPYLWQQLRCPIWCTRFTAAVLRRKLAESEGVAPTLHVVEPGQRFTVGPFDCELLHVTHSIPEAHALALRTPLGTVLHTGDWKLDPAPLLGPTSAVDALEALGREGVLAMVCDSTNILDPGTSGSEAEVRDSLMELVGRLGNRVVITTFASNVARLETAIRVAEATGRHPCAVGRSMRRMIEAAKEVGYLADIPPLLDERAAAGLAPEKVLWLATGCQGEPRAAMARIAAGQHPSVRLDPGDTVIFSSKIIPGNERTLYNLHNGLVRAGIEVITEQDHFVHVSGHPCRDEVEQMYRWIRPEIAVPVHGEARHLHEHLAFARRLGVRQPLEVMNGDLVRLAPAPAEVIDTVPTGRLVLDNGKILTAGDELFRTRRRLSSHGTIVVGLVLDRYGSLLAEPRLSVVGTIDLERVDGGTAGAVEVVEDAIESLDDAGALDDEQIRIAVRGALRRGLGLARERRPIIEVQITRLGREALAGLAGEAEPAR